MSFSGNGDQISQNVLDVEVGDKRGNVECNGVAVVLHLVGQSHGIGLGLRFIHCFQGFT